jgi:hypothetical protein
MSHFNTSVPFAATLGRLPITMLRMAVVVAFTMLVQGAMAQVTTPAPAKPRAAEVDRTGDAPAATPAATPAPARLIAAEVKATEAAPQAVPAAPDATGTAAPELTVPRVPEPSELRGAMPRQPERPRTDAVAPAPISAPVAPAVEVKQP